jgi:hypothetical protein
MFTQLFMCCDCVQFAFHLPVTYLFLDGKIALPEQPAAVYR